MGEPLSPDRVFDFLVDEPEPHPAYNFFAPGPLSGYAGNPNNNNGWIEAEEQVIALVVDMDEDITMLFGDDDKDDDSEGFDEEDESFPLPAPRLPVPPSVIEDLSTRLGNMEYGHRQLVQKVIQPFGYVRIPVLET
nr:hypothetical protein [Tanacetum cinerariifolium]